MAGHGSHDAKQAILTGKNGCILKPIQVKTNLNIWKKTHFLITFFSGAAERCQVNNGIERRHLTLIRTL